MEKITLGQTNEQVSVISLGAWSYGKENTSGGSNVGWANQSDQDSRMALLKAYSCEINHWDTADVYGEGHSEKVIGSMWEKIPRNNISLHEYLFGEDQSRYMIEIDEKNKNEVCEIFEKDSVYYEIIGTTQKESLDLENEFNMKLFELSELNSFWFRSYFKEN